MDYLYRSLQFEHYITLGGLIAPFVTAVCTLLLGWWLGERSKRAEAAANLAAKRAEPTGNGFAKTVTDQLTLLVARVDLLSERLDNHIDQRNDT